MTSDEIGANEEKWFRPRNEYGWGYRPCRNPSSVAAEIIDANNRVMGFSLGRAWKFDAAVSVDA